MYLFFFLFDLNKYKLSRFGIYFFVDLDYMQVFKNILLLKKYVKFGDVQCENKLEVFFSVYINILYINVIVV